MQNASSSVQFAVLGSGSWATALVKILSDNGATVHWYVRNEQTLRHIRQYKHNPAYLSSAALRTDSIQFYTNAQDAVEAAGVLILAIPSAYVVELLSSFSDQQLASKKIISAIKGLVPEKNLLLNDFLAAEWKFDVNRYYSIMGPCHAEEVAAEKLSYLTFSGLDEEGTQWLSEQFKNHYINTVINTDIFGVQFAAVLKNIYALGSGIAHGLEYGDNFLSVLIANAADEMAVFLRKVGVRNIEVGIHKEPIPGVQLLKGSLRKSANYAASVYLGDLLVTCYSPFSRNRTFGKMIGKGYSIKAAQLEMNMVAEGYNASRAIYQINEQMKVDMPIAGTVYKILWEQLPPAEGFRIIEETLI
ncbi:MAG: NAD(P)-binding domain-containing protein [Bacteroidetes bacterium]|nr:NAD(P)-binding domain-containing protein [Bacteroidota bacterium]